MEEEIVLVMSSSPNNIQTRSISQVRREGGFFQYGVAYTSASDEKIKYKKPTSSTDMIMMRANYGTFGQPKPNETHRKVIEEVIEEQIRKEREEVKRKRAQMKLERQFRKKLINKIIPDKVKTIIRNMPVLTPKNIYKYFRAELSNIEQGPVSLPVYEERKKICGGCPKRMFPPGYSDPLGFCTECGCGANPRAQLTIKLKLPATSCPLGKWDESPGIYEGLWGRIRYIFTRRRSK